MTYSWSEVEPLLELVWEESRYVGLPSTGAPDPDMPRSASDPRSTFAWVDKLIDTSSAVGRLSVADRQVLFLRFGLLLPQREAGVVLGLSHVTVGRRERCARRNLLRVLKGW